MSDPAAAIALYTKDLIALLAAKALQARQERDAASLTDRDYANGRLMAFHEVISLMQQQARAFAIPLEALGLIDINPERDLL